jgi:hypothetical protein
MGWGELIVGKEEKPGPHFPISFHHMGIFPNFTQQLPYTRKEDRTYNNGYSYLLTEAKKQPVDGKPEGCLQASHQTLIPALEPVGNNGGRDLRAL